MVDFPNVPDLPGVPAIPRSAGAVISAVEGLIADALGITGFGSAPQWGLFLDGEVAITADSVVAFGFKKSFSISNYPIEEGGFESYNKVQRPFTGRLRMATGGSVSDRLAFLAAVDAAVSSMDLYDIVTPEAVYSSVNVVDMNYDRSAVRGAGLLSVDIICEQVRVTASSAFTSASQGTGSSSGSSDTGDASTGLSVGKVTRGPDLAPLVSSPSQASSMPQVNGGNVQPVQAGPGEFDVNAVVQP
jgi:hypothetical protein